MKRGYAPKTAHIRPQGLPDKTQKPMFRRTWAFVGAMEGTRTPGLLIRSQSLYPAELPTHEQVL